jgi:hypothetical protein
MRQRASTTMAAASVAAAAVACRAAPGKAAVSAFVVPSTTTAAARRQRRPTRTTTPMTTGGAGAPPTMLARGDDAAAAAGRDDWRTVGAAAAAASRPLLDEAFSNFDDTDKYETVLSGLCAKIVDDGSEANARLKIVNPMRLLGEMNSMGIPIGPRGVVGLIDVSFCLECAYHHIGVGESDGESGSPLLPPRDASSSTAFIRSFFFHLKCSIPKFVFFIIAHPPPPLPPRRHNE